jgi:hypothetical protein
MAKEKKEVLKEAVIASKIFTLRGEKVLLDIHLAELYEVETRTLKQAVRRNRDRFPGDFMFELTEDEIDIVVSQFVIPSRKYLGGAAPFAFSENGVAMLSSVLTSKKAIEVNITIMRTFTMIRKMLLLNKDIMMESERIRKQLSEHANKIMVIFEYLKQSEKAKKQQSDQDRRARTGFRTSGKQ